MNRGRNYLSCSVDVPVEKEISEPFIALEMEQNFQ
jgi:hypothetical protein